MSDQEKFRCAIYRGGTSKAVFFMENELPADLRLREKVLMAVYGSPDVRQIDGLGGSDITTSKVAIIGPPSRDDADVDYTFGQVHIDRPGVSFQGNCGNISSAVGPFAVDEGLVRPKEPITTVRIHNTNTQKILIAEFPVFEGKAAAEGDFGIPGVPGTGAMIKMDWAGTAGSATGKLLPTGNVVDTFDFESIGKIQVSIVDAGNPVVFVLAEDVGATGMEHRLEINANRVLMKKLEDIRAAGAEAAGIIKDRNLAQTESPLAPQMAFVRAPADYTDYASGETIKAEEVSFLSRVLFNQMAVETYTGTGSVCTAVAAMIPGTIVNQVASQQTKDTGIVRIGHARGALEIKAKIEGEKNKWMLREAIIRRTARRLLEGYVYVKKSALR
ncbi:MAG: PrpF domain-containing protein [Pseudomonadota bacterium]